jgi:mitochondrial fission protein ELM1
MTEPVWVLRDPRAGTASQALGLAERLGAPFREVALEWGPLARLPWPVPTLLGLKDRTAFAPPWPRLVISAGRRAAPVALWLAARGARTVHAMRPGFGAARFDLLVIGTHDAPPPARNTLLIQGAMHRVTPGKLDEAATSFPDLAALPRPRVGLLLGGPVRAEGMAPEVAARVATEAAGLGASVMASTSRRTGEAAGAAAASALKGVPHRLHAFASPGRNPYLGMLALADLLVVTGDSISMLSEALMTTAPLLIADPGGLGPRHRALAEGFFAKGLAAPLGSALPAPRAALDETGRVAAEIQGRGWL